MQNDGTYSSRWLADPDFASFTVTCILVVF